jgi:hypothetical protein
MATQRASSDAGAQSSSTEASSCLPPSSASRLRPLANSHALGCLLQLLGLSMPPTAWQPSARRTLQAAAAPGETGLAIMLHLCEQSASSRECGLKPTRHPRKSSHPPTPSAEHQLQRRPMYRRSQAQHQLQHLLTGHHTLDYMRPPQETTLTLPCAAPTARQTKTSMIKLTTEDRH